MKEWGWRGSKYVNLFHGDGLKTHSCSVKHWGKRQAFFSQLEKSIFLSHSKTENAFLLSNIYFNINISKELVLFQGKIQCVLAFVNVFFDPYWNVKDKFVDISYSSNVLGNLVANSREPIKTNQTMAFFYQDTFSQ